MKLLRVIALVAAAVLGWGRVARAVCTAADVQACGASCFSCSGNTCTIAKSLTVTPPPAGVCTFDFGVRDIVLKGGGFLGGGSAFEIRANSLQVGNGGILTATGKTVGAGGTITLTLGAGGFTIASGANAVDVTGVPGGTLVVNADGNVAIGGAGILADGTTGIATGGIVTVTAGRQQGAAIAASGNISITSKVSATGPPGGVNSGGGAGGAITFNAIGGAGSGNVDVEATLTTIGGAGGGDIEVSSTGDVTLGTTGSGKLLLADGTGDAASGGIINVFAGGSIGGKLGTTHVISATGSAAFITTDGGGCGGQIAIEAGGGTLALGGASGGIFADGGLGGVGGGVCVMADTLGKQLTLGVPVTALGPGTLGSGGCLLVSSNGAATVTQDVDASGTGCGGTAEVDALTTIDLLAPAKAVRADGAMMGGDVTLSGGGTVTIGPAGTAPALSATAPAFATGGVGGSASVTTWGAISLAGLVNVSASGANGGGDIDVEAGKDVTLLASSELDADGGTGGAGGSITLRAGTPDLPGNLSLSGLAHARGSAPPAPFLIPASAILDACNVQLGTTATLDTSGDPGASNTIMVRKTLTLGATAKVTTTGGAGSANTVLLPTGAAAPPAARFTPAPVVTFEPLCTSAAQLGCLTPCPTCGDGHVDYPETCDNGVANGACQPCDATCRTFTCDDGDPCTTNTCDPLGGCFFVPIASCSTTTTTTTTITTTTHTTTTLPSTTTTAPATTTTTVAPTTTTTTTLPTTTTTTTLPTTTTTTTLPTTTTSSTTTTTATTTTAPSTTTTTLPGCNAAATFPSIGCRIGALGVAAGAEVPPGKFHDGLVLKTQAASVRLAKAEALAAAQRPYLKMVRGVARNMSNFASKLDSKVGRRVGGVHRLELIAAAEAIRADALVLSLTSP